MMDCLPDDILEKIYFEKPKLEMIDVFQEIKNKIVEKIETILSELELYLRNDAIHAFDIAVINVALRNDGYINDMELKFRLMNLNEYIHIYFDNTDEYYEEIDINLAMSNLITTIDDILSTEYYILHTLIID